MNQNRIIGDGNKLLWHLPGDLKRLKSLTMGTPLIMGRKTWDSIGKPLPGRGNIVLTNSKSWKAEGAIVVNSFKDAITRSNQWIEENKLINKLSGRENNDWHLLYKMTWALTPTKKLSVSYDASLNINQGYYMPRAFSSTYFP